VYLHAFCVVVFIVCWSVGGLVGRLVLIIRCCSLFTDLAWSASDLHDMVTHFNDN